MPSGTPVVGQHAFICPHCERAANAEVRGIAVWDGMNRERDDMLAPPAEWTFVQCDSCDSVSIEWREDYGEGFATDEPTFLYPESHRLSNDIPKKLRNEWEEAQKCFRAKSYTATVVMIRRTLEGTCKEQGINDRVLANALRKMTDQGKIDSTLADWATLLKIVGNQGAHYTGRQVHREDAEDALAFAEALLDHIYVLRKRFDEFRTRRAQQQ